MSFASRHARPSRSHSQRGQAMLLVVMLIVVGIVALVYNMIDPTSAALRRDQNTVAALAQAKEALIGYAAGVDLSGAGRPGDLPCPDRDNNGYADVPADYPCSGAALGRLPWKTLGLPDLRDGDGERLWYAVSSNFRSNPRTPCASPGDAGCLNSDSRGTITVRNSDGTVVNDGSNPDPYTPSGVIAVIIAPGRILHRQGAAAAQIRGCTVGVDCDATERCTASPVTLTPTCNPSNYLDILSGTEDNAGFTDGSSTDGFINGRVLDASGNLIVNDRILTITHGDLMPLLERRVAQEVLNCLTAYASVADNNGRYPWAAPVTNVTSPYADQIDTRFGRVPDTLTATLLGTSGGDAKKKCPSKATCMTSNWPSSCNMTIGSWWTNWKEVVFYGVADAYKPADPASPSSGVPAGGPCGICLTVNPPSASADKLVVVIVAGKRLSASAYPAGNNQPRSTTADKQSATNYLEGENVGGAADTYTQQSTAPSFNDVLLYQ